ncbi:hypothetical protein Tco_0625846 [Tanacetum coccineum]|uniref:Uncharacterized protein n=1 Tax=Tanacetum coccineum TaxID=301880 RepID=A0ABQ4WI36_9ASTR
MPSSCWKPLKRDLLVSWLELLGEKLSQEDINQKLLRSLSPEWNTHAIGWRNKADLDTMSMDDLYNNLKVYEPEVKGISSSNSSTHNIAFMSSSNNNSSSTNQEVNIAHGVSTASTQVNAANSTNIDNISNAVILQSSKISRQQEQGKLKKECACGNIYSTALMSCDGLGGYEWSDQAEEWLNYTHHGFSLFQVILKIGLESVEEKLEVYKANESIYVQDIKGLKFEIHIGEITIRELRKKLEIIVDNYKKGLGYENYNAVPPLYIGNFMPPTPDLSFISLDEFVDKPVVKNYKAMSSEEEPKVVRKNDDAPIIEEWVSDDEEVDVSQPKNEKKTVRPSIVKKEFVKSKQQEKSTRKTV